jgi:hypothetical protein
MEIISQNILKMLIIILEIPLLKKVKLIKILLIISQLTILNQNINYKEIKIIS